MRLSCTDVYLSRTHTTGSGSENVVLGYFAGSESCSPHPAPPPPPLSPTTCFSLPVYLASRWPPRPLLPCLLLKHLFPSDTQTAMWNFPLRVRLRRAESAATRPQLLSLPWSRLCILTAPHPALQTHTHTQMLYLATDNSICGNVCFCKIASHAICLSLLSNSFR